MLHHFQNLREVIEKVSKFLGKSYTEKQVDNLIDHLSIDNFRKNPMINGQELKDCGILNEGSSFVRKGASGDWRHYFSQELENEVDEWIAKNLMGTNIKFPVINNNYLQNHVTE